MAKTEIICGIDIGNSAIKTVIAEIGKDSFAPRIIGVGSAPSQGMRHGQVIDMEETMENISDSVKQAENMAGVKINKACVSLNGRQIKSQISHGVIAVARPDGEITPSDVARVTEAASTVSLPANYETVHIVPRGFMLDNQERVKNAVGMKGVRLEADVMLIEAMTQHMRNLAKCVNANGIEVLEFVFAPLAASQAVLTKHQKEYGVILVDFGGGVSSMAVFHEGELIHTAVSPIGSRYLTHDITIALATEVDKAEQIKLTYGQIGEGILASKKNDIIDVSDIIGEDGFTASKKQIARIIDARISDLFDFINGELKKITPGRVLPAGVIFVGGGSNLPGLIETAKAKIKLPVHKAAYHGFEGLISQASDPAFAVALGLIGWEMSDTISGEKRTAGIGTAGILGKLSRWFKNFLP